VHTTIDQVVEVKVLLSTKHARRARFCEKSINDISKTRGQSGHMGFCKESISRWSVRQGVHAPASGHLTNENLKRGIWLRFGGVLTMTRASAQRLDRVQ
jgi:ribosomal protein L5